MKRGTAVATNGIGVSSQAHLNLTVSLDDVRKREQAGLKVGAFPNRFASKSRPQVTR